MKKSTPTPLRDLCLSHFKILRIPILPNDLDAVLDRADCTGGDRFWLNAKPIT